MGYFADPGYLVKFTDDDTDQLVVSTWDDDEYVVMIKTSDNGVIFTKEELDKLIDKLQATYDNL